jgi:hypothetical protein
MEGVTGDILVSDTLSQWDRMMTVPQRQHPPPHAALNVTWSGSPDSNNRQRRQTRRRRSHSIVERKYRVNLNSKFRQLQEVVLEDTRSSPILTGQIPPTRRDGVEAKMMRGASSPKNILSKADILDIAMSYIGSLKEQISSLRERLHMVETLGRSCSWS